MREVDVRSTVSARMVEKLSVALNRVACCGEGGNGELCYGMLPSVIMCVLKNGLPSRV
ncbi:hypothetical protein [Pseudomonas amygdali]|uniref:hypothetical protein n=1 Tax=Pseudomonas amygdali TaxID=47877 RepID=UPI00244E6C13|nr:hypothetical protein [Pseudomonas amygdali]